MAWKQVNNPKIEPESLDVIYIGIHKKFIYTSTQLFLGLSWCVWETELSGHTSGSELIFQLPIKVKARENGRWQHIHNVHPIMGIPNMLSKRWYLQKIKNPYYLGLFRENRRKLINQPTKTAMMRPAVAISSKVCSSIFIKDLTGLLLFQFI